MKGYPSKHQQPESAPVLEPPKVPPSTQVPFAIQARVIFPSLRDTISRFHFKTVVDPNGNRVKTEMQRNVFATGVYQEEEITVLDLSQNRLLVANSFKDMCLKHNIKEISSSKNTIQQDDNEYYDMVEVVDDSQDKEIHLDSNDLIGRMLSALVDPDRMQYLGLHTLT